MKSSDALRAIIDLIPHLSDGGMQTLRKHVTALCQFSRKQDLDGDWLLEGLIYEIQRQGLADTIPPRFHVKNDSSFAGFVNKSIRIRTLFEQALPDMNELEKQALGRLSARVLAEYVSEYRGLSFITLLASVHYVIDALNAAFPGYIQNGMLRFIIGGLNGRSGSEQRDLGTISGTRKEQD